MTRVSMVITAHHDVEVNSTRLHAHVDVSGDGEAAGAKLNTWVKNVEILWDYRTVDSVSIAVNKALSRFAEAIDFQTEASNLT